MSAFTTMSSKGQLTIPKEVRDQLNLTAGTKFYVTVHNGEVVARPKNKRIADLAGFLGKPPSGAGARLEEIDEAIGHAIAEEDARIVREWRDSHAKGE